MNHIPYHFIFFKVCANFQLMYNSPFGTISVEKDVMILKIIMKRERYRYRFF